MYEEILLGAIVSHRCLVSINLCVFVLCDELESKSFFTLLTGYYANCGDDVSNQIDDIKQTMKAISVLEKVKMD